MSNFRSAFMESAGAVGQVALQQSHTDSLAELRPAGDTVAAFPAGRTPGKDHMVARFYGSDVATDFLHNASPFVAEYGRWRRKGQGTVHHREVAMADATRGYLHQHLCAFRLIEVDLFDFHGSVVLVEYCGFHGVLLFFAVVRQKSCGILWESSTSQQALFPRRSLAGFRT